MTLAFLNIGTQEMILIVIVILLLFGGKKLPELARGLGRGIREFKDASDGIKREISDQINNFEKDLDVKVEDSPKTNTYQNTLAEATPTEPVVEEAVVVQEEQGKKFPEFTAPENTYQHNPGGHPADNTEYYKYGYSDHFSTEDNSTEGQTSSSSEKQNEGEQSSDSKKA